MATTVAPISNGITLATVKRDFGRIAEVLSKGGIPGLRYDAGVIDVLKAINASTDTTDLRTT